MTITDSKQFTFKNKSVVYIKAFVELYNYKNYKKVYKIYNMIEFEKKFIRSII